MSAEFEFIDTNVLLYAFDTTEPAKHSAATALLERLWTTRTGCLSVQVMQEFFVAATRKLKRPLERAAARAVLEDYSQWIVHAPTASDVIQASALMETTNVSFWDAMMLTSARELGCVQVWTEDLNASQRIGGVLVRNPFAL